MKKRCYLTCDQKAYMSKINVKPGKNNSGEQED